MKPVAQCKVCKKTITTAEIEVGTSLVCPSCDPKSAKEAKSKAENSRDSMESAEKK